MWLFLAFVAVPLIEIALFIQVGGMIGLWPTLAIVVLTAIVGYLAGASQGAQALRDCAASFNRTARSVRAAGAWRDDSGRGRRCC